MISRIVRIIKDYKMWPMSGNLFGYRWVVAGNLFHRYFTTNYHFMEHRVRNTILIFCIGFFRS
jgi:hypothetical protein